MIDYADVNHCAKQSRDLPSQDSERWNLQQLTPPCLWFCDEMFLFPRFTNTPKSRIGQSRSPCLGRILLTDLGSSCNGGDCRLVQQYWPQHVFCNRNIRVAVLPCLESTSCLFRTRPVEVSDNLMYNEVFWVSISYPALRQKTLRVDVCTVDKSRLEECLVSIHLFQSIFCVDFSFLNRTNF